MFYDEATGDTELADAFVTLAVHSEIASSDAICAAKLGRYSASESHSDAIGLLRKADPDAAKHLGRLLGLKTKAGYTHRPVSGADVRAADRGYKALLLRAESA